MGKPPGLLLRGAGGTPPPTNTDFLPTIQGRMRSRGFCKKHPHEEEQSWALCSSEEAQHHSAQAAFAGSFADSRHKQEMEKKLHPWGKRSTWWKNRECKREQDSSSPL